MPVQWIYSTDGKPAYFQRELYVYEASGEQREFINREGCWYSLSDGRLSYTVRESWVYTPAGKPVFYYEDG